MKPRDLAGAIRKRGWLIIVITILAALIASVAARVQSPTYKVEIDVAAVPPVDPTTQQPSYTIAAIYAGAAMSSISNATESIDIADAVHDGLLAKGIDIPAEDLLAKVKSETDATATFTRITVTDSSPTRVAEIANTWGEVLEIRSSDNANLQDPNLKQVLLDGHLVVTNNAVAPKKPTQPKPMVYLGLGIFLGLVLGFSTVFGIEYFDPHFRSIEDVEDSTGLEVLGSIPKLKASEAISLLSSDSGVTSANEAYSQLRSSIMFSVSGRPSKSALIVPAIPTEEAPFLAANLSRSIAFTERKVLLVDCDLRQQGVSRLMGAAGKTGLADSLAARKPIESAIIDADLPYLSLLPAGRLADNSSDLLSLPLLDEYLRRLEKEYDQIIIYAPALILAFDGAVVASKVDLSLVVIDSERCSRSVVQSAMENFNILHLKPTGVVLSNVKMKRRERAMRARMTADRNKERVKARAVAAPAKVLEKAPQEPHKARSAEKSLRQAPVRTEVQVPAEEPRPQAAPERRPAITSNAKVAKAEKPPKAARAPFFTRKAKADKQPKAATKKMTPAKRIEPRAEAARPAPASSPPAVSKVGSMDEVKPDMEGSKPGKEKISRADPFQGQPSRAVSRITPVAAAENKTEEELAQLKEVLAEDFRRMGSSGASIPKDWLRALNSEEGQPRDLARIAISAYYMAFLRRYDISEESVKRITESIIRMMRKEDEFSSMSEKEAQAHLQKMLVDAGARFSSGTTNSRRTATAGTGASSVPPGPEAKVDRERKRKERRFLKQETAAQKKEEVAETPTNPQTVDTKLWQDKGGEEDWEWD